MCRADMNHVWSRRTQQWAWPHPVRCVRWAAAVGATEKVGDGENCFCVAFLQCVWPLTSLLCPPRLAFQTKDFLQYAKGCWGLPVLLPVSVYLRLTSETLQKLSGTPLLQQPTAFFWQAVIRKRVRAWTERLRKYLERKGIKDPFGVATSLAR